MLSGQKFLLSILVSFVVSVSPNGQAYGFQSVTKWDKASQVQGTIFTDGPFGSSRTTVGEGQENIFTSDPNHTSRAETAKDDKFNFKNAAREETRKFKTFSEYQNSLEVSSPSVKSSRQTLPGSALSWEDRNKCRSNWKVVEELTASQPPEEEFQPKLNAAWDTAQLLIGKKVSFVPKKKDEVPITSLTHRTVARFQKLHQREMRERLEDSREVKRSSGVRAHGRRLFQDGGGIRGGIRMSRDIAMKQYVSRGDSAPQLVEVPVEKTVSPDTTVTLRCSARGSPRPDITWTRDGVILTHSHRLRVSNHVSMDGSVVSELKITRAETLDGGLILCEATNIHGRVTHTARLNIYGPPFVRSGSNVTAVEGKTARLWCPAGGYPPPTVSWTRAGLPIPPELRYSSLANNSLLISRVSSKDSGLYTCTAADESGQRAAGDVLLTIIRPPKIGRSNFLNDQEEGLRNQLNCMVTSGDLPMTVTWLKDGGHLPHDPDMSVKQTSEFSSVIVFHKLSERHSGSYTCLVTNSAGSVNMTDNLEVKVSPRWIVEPQGQHAVVGDVISLHCQSRGVPLPATTWMKAEGAKPANFQPLSLSIAPGSLIQAPNGTLVFPSVTKDDSGWYLCQASNGVGHPISKYVQLTVNAGAKILTPGDQLTGHSGELVRFTCQATGDSPLAITWRRSGVLLTETDRVAITEQATSDGISSVVSIARLSSADAGQYRCIASNAHASDEGVFTLQILEPPSSPENISLADLSSRSVTVGWDLVQPMAVTLQYKALRGHSSFSDWFNMTVSQWSQEHRLTELLPNTPYHLRMFAHNQLGTSLPSKQMRFTTLQEAPSGSPEEVKVIPLEPESLHLKWWSPPASSTNGDLRGYILVLRQQNLRSETVKITRPVTVGARSFEQYTVRGLHPGTLYEVAIGAFNNAGVGPLSTPRIIRATLHSAPRCPPTGVTCRGTGPSSIRVSWDPPAPPCSSSVIHGYTLSLTPTDHSIGNIKGETVSEFTTNLEKSVAGLQTAANISVRVRAYNGQGLSLPSQIVYCNTHYGIPSAPVKLRAISTGVSSIVASWSAPLRQHGPLLHYTVYIRPRDKAAQRHLVTATNIDSTWQDFTDLQMNLPLQIWVTATTSAGEGPPSPLVTLRPHHSSSQAPLILTGERVWRVTQGSGLTLGCRRIGSPEPRVEWMKTTSEIRESSGVGGRVGVVSANGGRSKEQILPGGDLHVSDIELPSNYSCHARNLMGVDHITHMVLVTSQPSIPTLSVIQSTHSSINISIHSPSDGGAPILGHTLYFRLPSGSWEEISVTPNGPESPSTVLLSSLPCGTAVHIYGTSWNRYGTSSASAVLDASTKGDPPARPQASQIILMNDTCLTLSLYNWPERGCPVTSWKVEQQLEQTKSRDWQVIQSPVLRSSQDFGLCDLTSGRHYLFKITAQSEAGAVALMYRVSLGHNRTDDGFATKSFIREITLSSAMSEEATVSAHIIAGVLSAVLLSIAFLICVCVAISRKDIFIGSSNRHNSSTDVDTKEKIYTSIRSGHERNDSHSTPIKRSKSQSAASLASHPSVPDEGYEIYPYATFGVHNMMEDNQGTLQYGLTHSQSTMPRDCLEGTLPITSEEMAHHQPPAGWRETDVSFVPANESSSTEDGNYGKISLARPRMVEKGGRDCEMWVQLEKENLPTKKIPADVQDSSSESYGTRTPHPIQNQYHPNQFHQYAPKHYLPHQGYGPHQQMDKKLHPKRPQRAKLAPPSNAKNR